MNTKNNNMELFTTEIEFDFGGKTISDSSDE